MFLYHMIARAVLTTLARSVMRVLNRAQVPYWADYGTLLGLVRDGGIVYKDTDVDVCVLEDPDTLARLDACCAQRHALFTLRRDPHRRSYCAYMRLLPARCDIYVYRPRGDGMLKGCEGPYSDIPAALVNKRISYRWRGLSVWIPQDPERVLQWRYGPGWRVPRHRDLGRLQSTYTPSTPQQAALRTTDIGW